MKKLALLVCAFAGFVFTSCGKKPVEIITSKGNNKYSINCVDLDDSVKLNQKYDGESGIMVINGKKVTKRYPINIDLSAFANSDVEIKFSADLKILSPNETEKFALLLNDVSLNFPALIDTRIETGKWVHISSTMSESIGEKKQIYLSNIGMPVSDMMFYFKNFNFEITAEKDDSPKVSFRDAPGLREAYAGKFEYIGLAIGRNELENKTVQELLKKNADCITMGNEFKPDFTFAWTPPKKLVDFKAEDGKLYKVPESISMRDVGACLKAARDNGLIMRGHVLVWHSQTPHFFFTDDWTNDGKLVDRATMTAREEWYIKYVMEYVRDWEIQNNGGEHVLRYWDVVNEAINDNPTSKAWFRTNGDWYNVFGDETYIVNAFRFANRYAPADVKLVYNDYSSASGQERSDQGKHGAILKLIDEILATPGTRLDAVGMQSHVNINSPVTGPFSFESAIQNFLAKGIDVQITELDIATGDQKYNALKMKSRYKEYYKLFLKYRKTADTANGVTGVTIWGLNDESTWLNGMDMYKGHTQYPLLFTTTQYKTKPAYYGVLEAVEE